VPRGGKREGAQQKGGKETERGSDARVPTTIRTTKERQAGSLLSDVARGTLLQYVRPAASLHPSPHTLRWLLLRAMLPCVPREARDGEGMAPLNLTLVPTAWTREAGQREVIEYSVHGLPSEKRTVILMCLGGWRVIRDPLPDFDQGKLYPSPEIALAALKAWIEVGEKPPNTGE
jgi:hypothetical protein